MKLGYKFKIFEYKTTDKEFIDEFYSSYNFSEDVIVCRLGILNNMEITICKFDCEELELRFYATKEELDFKYIKDFISRFSNCEKGFVNLYFSFYIDRKIAENVIREYKDEAGIYEYLFLEHNVGDWLNRITPVEDILYKNIKDYLTNDEDILIKKIFSDRIRKMYGEE